MTFPSPLVPSPLDRDRDPADPATADLDHVRVACQHAERCGGCPSIELSYGEQLTLKRGLVVHAMARYSALERHDCASVVAATPIVGYRTRAKLIVSHDASIGLFEKGGDHSVVDVPNCRVLSPLLSEVANSLRRRVATDLADLATRGALAPFDPALASSGGLRAIDLREVRDPTQGDAKVLVTFVMQRERAADLVSLREAARSLCDEIPAVIGVAVNFHEGQAPQILGSETVLVHGVPAAFDRLGGSTHLATFGSFVQAHRGQAERIHALLAEAMEGVKSRAFGHRVRVLDLYGGSGAIALALAARGADVVLVESFAPAVRHAQAAATSQELTLRAECGDVGHALRSLKARGERFDAVIVNPPRRGMSASARDSLSRLEVPLLAYVSCDPDTLARDLDHFSRLGFPATELRPFDMMPLTAEVETVAILRRTSIPTPRVVYEDDSIVVVEKGPHEPTTPQGEYAGSLLGRVRQIRGAEDCVPVHRIDIGTSGLVMFAKLPSGVAKWARMLAAPNSRKIYVAATRGVTPIKGAIRRDLQEGGKSYAARTRYRRLAVVSGHSLLRVIPEQGRTHQIRRHLAAIGHPILGDDRYGHAPTNRFFEEKNGLDRTFLHCMRFELQEPETGAQFLFEVPLPGDLRAVLEQTTSPGTLRFLDDKNALGTSGGMSSAPGSRL